MTGINDKISLKYKDRRDEGDTTLRQCQLAQLHLLYVFDAVCEKFGLRYVLDGGTLMGAMRHDGFIPWDDDLDVGMMRRDYNRFLKLARSALPTDVILQTPKDVPERVIGFSKLRDAYSFYAESGMGISLKRPNGIFIDIFPYDEMPNLSRRMEGIIAWICKRSWQYARALRCSGGRGIWWSLLGGWASLALYTIHYGVVATIRILGLVIPCRRVYYDLKTPFPFAMPKAALFPAVKHIFEDGEFSVPNDSDCVLTAQYGNWRQLPPEDQRHGDHGKLILPFQTTKVPGAMEWK